MYFRLGGGTVKGVSKPGNIVWSRVFIMDGRLHCDLGLAKVVKLPEAETERRWRETTPQWPIMHAVLQGISRDQMIHNQTTSGGVCPMPPGRACLIKAAARPSSASTFTCGVAGTDPLKRETVAGARSVQAFSVEALAAARRRGRAMVAGSTVPAVQRFNASQPQALGRQPRVATYSPFRNGGIGAVRFGVGRERSLLDREFQWSAYPTPGFLEPRLQVLYTSVPPGGEVALPAPEVQLGATQAVDLFEAQP
jgi:hypothetical protein